MYYFIVNLHGRSGKAKKIWDTVEATLKENEIAYKASNTEDGNSATSLARRICELESGTVNLVVVGGDGTVNEVINGIREEDFPRIRFGVIPTGSGNDFARGLDIPRHNPRKALMRILNATGGKKLDLGLTRTPNNPRRLFAISSGIGFDAIVGVRAGNSKLKKVLNALHLGKFVYLIYTVSTLLTMPSGYYKVTFDDGEILEFNKLIFMACMNLTAEGGGVPMNPLARSDDGKLSICLAYNISNLKAFLMFPFLVLGKHGNKKGFLLKDCTAVDIYGKKPTTVHTDGEDGGEVSTAHFECLKGKLTMLV